MKRELSMQRTNSKTVDTTSGQIEVYSSTARTFHWLIVLLLLGQIPVGMYMAYRGGELNIWDATTNNLYSGHKLVGLVILALVVLRLLYRLAAGAPRPEPTIESWQHNMSRLNHWGLYLLLLIVPILGYLGVAMYPALNLFGAFNLPALVGPDKSMAENVFEWHEAGALALLALIALHIAAALYHYVIRQDNVLGRMLPPALRKD
jgi:cytochrome b561